MTTHAHIALPPGTPDHISAALADVGTALNEIAARHGLNGRERAFVQAAMIVATCTAGSGTAPEVAAERYAAMDMAVQMLLALTLVTLESEPADEHHDEPEIAALKAMRPAGNA